MKKYCKILILVAFTMFAGMSAKAQLDEFLPFGYSGEEDIEAGTRGTSPVVPELPDLPGYNDDDDPFGDDDIGGDEPVVPLGEGLVLLTGFGVAYMLRKKSK